MLLGVSVMREDLYGRGVRSVPADLAVAPVPVIGAMPPRAYVGGSGDRVDSVPSDQLWRAAVSAARQAATTAAELRRALGEARTAPPL